MHRTELRRPSLTRGQCPGAAAIALIAHRADLTLTLSPPSLGGHGEVRLRALDPARAVQLDRVGLRISAATSGDQPLRFRLDRDTACFELPQPLAAGDELTLSLSWQADPRASGLMFSPDQAWAVYTPSWLPTRLDPEQRATLKVTWTVPEGLDVVPGQLFEMRGNGLTRVTHVLSAATSPSLFTFAVGHFRKSQYYGQGFGLSAAGPPDADLMAAIERILPAYQFFRERLGAGAARGYSQLFVRGDVSQDAPGMSMLSEQMLRGLQVDPDPAEEWPLVHALAHQWFGVLVPGVDLWLDEGFATFMVGVMKERRWGHAAYEQEVARWRSRLPDAHGRDGAVALAPRAQAGGFAYYRGALVLDQLRRELGEPTFWDGLQHYLVQQTGKPTRTEDLRKALEERSGRDLKAFFDRWVYAL